MAGGNQAKAFDSAPVKSMDLSLSRSNSGIILFVKSVSDISKISHSDFLIPRIVNHGDRIHTTRAVEREIRTDRRASAALSPRSSPF